jgi:hypothetical protein
MTPHSPLIRDLFRLQKQEIIASWKPRLKRCEREHHRERAETYRKALNFILKETELNNAG